MAPIEHPKVFISYAWSSEEYQERVLSFASKLRSDGIDVILDKWDLQPGNDMYAFMEKCVTDDSVTNVLMLLDPLYAEKANARAGGVGAETLIISSEVYQKADQSKFIPVVFDRGENNSICKPAYLQSRFHIDLSVPEEYDNNYANLIKKLYGQEVYKKPPLGKKPAWVTTKVDIGPKSLLAYEEIKRISDIQERAHSINNYLNDIQRLIVNILKDENEISLDPEGIIEAYDKFSSIRNQYLSLLKYIEPISGSHKYVASFFEETSYEYYFLSTTRAKLGKTLIHELFLYTVSLYLKNKNYLGIGYILNKTYINPDSIKYNENLGIRNFRLIDEILGKAVKRKYNENYYSGEAKYWLDNILYDFCTKEDFVLADLICYNYTIYGKNYHYKYWWFPVTYCYDEPYRSVLDIIAKKMVSKDNLRDIMHIFGYDSANDFINKCREVETMRNNGEFKDCCFSSSFYSPRILSDVIKSDQIGSMP